jgi:acyl-CoA synthetase (AMP-forming)/AMP-acid ligase II
VSVPVDDNDITRGFRDLSYDALNNAANHVAQWLRQHLPQTAESFQCFAYAGPKDLRYPILAVAAAKLQKVVGFGDYILVIQNDMLMLFRWCFPRP